MWIAWGAWVVNGTIFDKFLQFLHCFYTTFHCAAQDFMWLPCYQIQKTEICCKFFFDRKRTCTASTFVMCKSNCEDFEH